MDASPNEYLAASDSTALFFLRISVSIAERERPPATMVRVATSTRGSLSKARARGPRARRNACTVLRGRTSSTPRSSDISERQES